jgi:nucleoside-diphosphate-sugar epimerase
MESLLIDFCQSESIQFGIFRLSNVYGNKIDGSISGGFINTAIRSAFNHEVFKIVRNSQNFYRDFIFIDDVVYILSFLIMRFNFNSNLIVNIASGSSYNLCEVKNIILQKLSEYGITLSLEDLIDDYIGPKVTSFNNDMLQKLIPSLIFTQLKKGILQTIIRTQNFYDLKNP